MFERTRDACWGAWVSNDTKSERDTHQPTHETGNLSSVLVGGALQGVASVPIAGCAEAGSGDNLHPWHKTDSKSSTRAIWVHAFEPSPVPLIHVLFEPPILSPSTDHISELGPCIIQ